MCARLAKRAAATITVIDYRLAPEHVYPAAIDDCVAAYRAIVAEVDPALVTIAGDSAGGGATLATVGALKAAGDPLPGAVYVLSPWTDLTASGESLITRAPFDPMFDGTGLPEAAMTYAGDIPLDDPGVSPLFADPTGYPPTLIQTGMDEILLSDSVRLAERYEAAGVDVRLDLRDELWHVYQAFAGYMPEATEALVRAAVFIREQTPARRRCRRRRRRRGSGRRHDHPPLPRARLLHPRRGRAEPAQPRRRVPTGRGTRPRRGVHQRALQREGSRHAVGCRRGRDHEHADHHRGDEPQHAPPDRDRLVCHHDAPVDGWTLRARYRARHRADVRCLRHPPDHHRADGGLRRRDASTLARRHDHRPRRRNREVPRAAPRPDVRRGHPARPGGVRTRTRWRWAGARSTT
jgi:hypothetical protein